MKVPFAISPSASVPVPVSVRANGADPDEDGVAVRLAQTGAILAACVGEALAVTVGVIVRVGAAVTVTVGLGAPQVAAVTAICAGIEPADENTFSVVPSVPEPERILVFNESISIRDGVSVLASGFMVIVATFVETVRSLSMLCPVVSVKDATPLE